MKTIECYLLQYAKGHDVIINTKVTLSEEEALSWYNSGDNRDYETLEITLPQEIQVQRDY